MLRSLRKLKGRSSAEIRDRVRQGVALVAERTGLAAAKVPEINETCVCDTPLFPDLREILHCLESDFSDDKDFLLDKAAKICEGRFDLLGYKDLYFGDPVPDWHFDPVSEKRSPLVHWSKINEVSAEDTGDKKIIWELNRHQYFVTLGLAFNLIGDDKYAKKFVADLEDWLEVDPPKIGVNWLSSLELAFRSISWIQAYYLFRESDLFTAKLRSRMLGTLIVHARHIETYLSTYFSPNTHLTGEALGLYFIGSFLSNHEESGRWKDKGYEILMDTLAVHIRDDGSYCEQSSHYARYTADIYASLMILRQRQGMEIAAEHMERLERLYSYLLHLIQPNSETALFGDDDGGRLFPVDGRPIGDMRPALALGAVLFERKDLRYVAGNASFELAWLSGKEGIEKYRGLTPSEPDQKAVVFKDGGIFAARNTWGKDADHIISDFGPHGFMNAGHAHADALSFILSLRGEPLFVDSGTFVYTSDLDARDRYRSSAAHNCLTVNGASSSIPDGPFSWKTMANTRLIEWENSSDGAKFIGSHDGFEKNGVSYHREIEYRNNGRVQIVESIKSNAENSFELHLIISPDVDTRIENGSVYFTKENRPSWRPAMKTKATGAGIVDNGWSLLDWKISPIYGKQIATKKLVYTVYGKGDIRIITEIECT